MDEKDNSIVIFKICSQKVNMKLCKKKKTEKKDILDENKNPAKIIRYN